MTKYDPLYKYLSVQTQTTVKMKMSEIETVLGFDLPLSARTSTSWWEMKIR